MDCEAVDVDGTISGGVVVSVDEDVDVEDDVVGERVDGRDGEVSEMDSDRDNVSVVCDEEDEEVAEEGESEEEEDDEDDDDVVDGWLDSVSGCFTSDGLSLAPSFCGSSFTGTFTKRTMHCLIDGRIC